jgi:RNA polymerase sigma-70 factor (ECF subfamily)
MPRMNRDDRTAAGNFPQTQWSLVQRARSADPTDETRSALEDICRRYWLPLYAFIRRSGHRGAEAEELTQEFIVRLIEGEYLSRADRERGKLRTFLLACLKHFLADRHRADQRLKRGGQHEHVSIDHALAENAYGAEPVDAMTPDLLFERRWAMSQMDQVIESIAAQMEDAGTKQLLYAAIPFARRGAPEITREDAAAQLGMSPEAVKMAISRLRQRFREQLRLAVAETLGPDDDLESEMQHLRSVLAEAI